MGGIFTRGETVRLHALWVDGEGRPAVPVDPKISIIQAGTYLETEQAMSFDATKGNLTYFDYVVDAAQAEGDVSVIYEGEIDGELVMGSDEFQVSLMKNLIERNFKGNQRLTFYPATSVDPVRKTEIGVLDKILIEAKYDGDPSTFSTIRHSAEVFMHYDVQGDTNPIKSGEDA